MKKQFLTVLILTGILSNISVFAQKRQTTKPKTQTVSSNQKTTRCSGGWSGVVSLKKTLKDSLISDEPGIRKDIDRIKHNNSRDYNYDARAIIDSSANPQQPTVNSKVSFTDDDKNWGEERVFDTCNSRESGHWFIIEGTDNRFTEAKAAGSAQSFNLSVDEISGNYNFSLQFPNADGTYKREQHVKRSGHCQPKNNEPYDKTDNEPFKITGETISIERQQIDPNNPDKLTGSKTWGDDGTGAIRTFVYTATWTFTRCPQKLLITDLRFEDMKFPTWNNWQEIVEETGTIDGNLVRVKAKVLNLSTETKFTEITFKETYKGDKWDGARPDYPLHESVSIRLDGGEEREVEILWNSQGFAWFDDGRPRLLQRIKTEAWEDFKLKDEMTKNLKISPKPIVFVPGIWSSPKILELYQNLLTVSHSYGWKAAIGKEIQGTGTINTEGQTVSAKGGKSVYDKADNLTKYVENIQKTNNAWHVDMVAHSTGGLVARLYIHKQMQVLPDNYPVVKHLMMLGTPNLGVPCADSMKWNDAYDNIFTTAKEIMPAEIAIFNQYVNQRKGTQFSTLVGNGSSTLCASIEKSDGFVSVESAKFGVEDYAFTKDSHPDLIEPIHFGEFIKPHVVTGPRGTYPLPVVSEAGGKDIRNN